MQSSSCAGRGICNKLACRGANLETSEAPAKAAASMLGCRLWGTLPVPGMEPTDPARDSPAGSDSCRHSSHVQSTCAHSLLAAHADQPANGHALWVAALQLLHECIGF